MAVNYTDKDSITIYDINDTPISTGHNYTLGSVFGALNKIIKAIINKFKKVDSEIITLHNGKIGNPSWDINVERGKTATEIITVDSSNYFTHGYIYTCQHGRYNKTYTLNHITQSNPVVSESAYGDSVPTYEGSSKYVTSHARIQYTVTHDDNNGTYIEVKITNLENWNFKYSNFEFKYELY